MERSAGLVGATQPGSQRRGGRRAARAAGYPGARTLRVMVLALDEEDLIGVDVASGVLVRTRLPRVEAGAGLFADVASYSLVEATLADPPELDDPAQPETLLLAEPPTPIGKMRSRRRARRLLQPIAGSPAGPLLGFPGTAARYWTFSGANPSATLVRLEGEIAVYRSRAGGSAVVRLAWRGGHDRLPLADPAAVAALEQARGAMLGAEALRRSLGLRPRFALVALTPPIDGNCYKVVRKILPRP
ncbi:MAG: hypothetical protein M0020_06675 [Actinomycetota bacterium]|nr:hypothetical protein [Actinomycetota bacterium]